MNKWIEVRRLQDLPSKFEQSTITTLRDIGKFKVKQVRGALGYRDFTALVGKEMRGLGIPREQDDADHETRFLWVFNPENTGL